jgi:hypothetical protein
MPRVNPFAAFAAGFGTSYIQSQKNKREQDRQDKIDAREQARFEQEQKKFEETNSLNDKIKALPTETYGTSNKMGLDEARAALGGVKSADDAGYKEEAGGNNIITDEAAQHYVNNVASPKQINSNAASIAGQMGVANPLADKTAFKDASGEVKLGDNATAQAVPIYKTMEDAAKLRIQSTDPAQQTLGYQALARASELKSEEMTKGVIDSYKSKGIDGVAEYMGKHSGVPMTDIRIEKPAGGYDANGAGTYNVYGKINGEERLIKSYDMNQYKGKSIDDVILGEAQQAIEPKKFFEYQRRNWTDQKEAVKEERLTKREDKKDANDQTIFNLDRVKKESDNKVAVGTEADRIAEVGLKNKASNASIASSLANTEKTKIETGILKAGGGKPLSASDQQESASIVAARTFLNSKYKTAEDARKAIADDGYDALGNAKDKRLSDAYTASMKPDPKMVNVYGSDPHLDRFVSGRGGYKETPLPPKESMLSIGKKYEFPDGTIAKWNGKVLIPVK